MFISHEDDVPVVELSGDQLKGVRKQVLIGAQEGWDDYVMRQFHLKAGGFTPRHSHGWLHINYVTSGKGTLLLGEREYPIKKGSIAYVSPGLEHQFRADQGSDVSFICIVPPEGDA
jgi:quercetin dioxygenase-like cupin family protein